MDLSLAPPSPCPDDFVALAVGPTSVVTFTTGGSVRHWDGAEGAWLVKREHVACPIALGVGADGVLMAVSSEALHLSRDGGRTWVARPQPSEVLHPSAPGTCESAWVSPGGSVLRVVCGENSRADFYGAALGLWSRREPSVRVVLSGDGAATSAFESFVYPYVSIDGAPSGALVLAGRRFSDSRAVLAQGRLDEDAGRASWSALPAFTGQVARAFALPGGGVLLVDEGGGLHRLGADGFDALSVETAGRRARVLVVERWDGAGRLWLVGQGGLVLQSADGGRQWRAVESGVSLDLLAAAWDAGRQRLWIAGAAGTLRALEPSST